MKKLLVLVFMVVGLVSEINADENIYSNDGKLKLQGLYKKKFYIKFYEESDGAINLYAMQKIPFYTEYDYSENKTGANWCGYAAMKSAVKGVTGKYARLDAFANASIANKYTKTIDDDIYIHHLYYLSYDKVIFSNTYLKSKLTFNNRAVNSSKKMLSEVVDATLKNKGALIIASNDYGGHFYVIVGIKIHKATNGNTSLYYLVRDVALEKAESIYFDNVIEIEDFYNNSMGNKGNTSQKPTIKVLP